MRGVATSKRELPPKLRELVATPAHEGDLRKLLGRMTPGQRRAMWLGAFIAIGHTSIADGLRAWIQANRLAPLDPSVEIVGKPTGEAPTAPVVAMRPPPGPVERRRLGAERNAEIVRLVGDGYKPSDVALTFGISSQRVGQIVQKYGGGG